MRIVQPQAGGAVRNDDGRVPVFIALEPGLQRGHRVTLTIDGRPLSSTFDDLSIELSGVQRGSHELQAAISDATGTPPRGRPSTTTSRPRNGSRSDASCRPASVRFRNVLVTGTSRSVTITVVRR